MLLGLHSTLGFPFSFLQHNTLTKSPSFTFKRNMCETTVIEVVAKWFVCLKKKALMNSLL